MRYTQGRMIKQRKEFLEIQEMLEEMKDFYVLVEGINDKIALQRQGLKKIITINKRPIYLVAEDIAKKTNQVIILTDFDKEGEKLKKRILSEASQFSVVEDKILRLTFFKKTKIRQVEELTNRIHNLNRFI